MRNPGRTPHSNHSAVKYFLEAQWYLSRLPSTTTTSSSSSPRRPWHWAPRQQRSAPATHRTCDLSKPETPCFLFNKPNVESHPIRAEATDRLSVNHPSIPAFGCRATLPIRFANYRILGNFTLSPSSLLLPYLSTYLLPFCEVVD